MKLKLMRLIEKELDSLHKADNYSNIAFEDKLEWVKNNMSLYHTIPGKEISNELPISKLVEKYGDTGYSLMLTSAIKWEPLKKTDDFVGLMYRLQKGFNFHKEGAKRACWIKT